MKKRYYFQTGTLRFVYSECPDDPWSKVRLTFTGQDNWHKWTYVDAYRTPYATDMIQTLLQRAKTQHPELKTQMDLDPTGLVLYQPSADFPNAIYAYRNYN